MPTFAARVRPASGVGLEGRAGAGDAVLEVGDEAVGLGTCVVEIPLEVELAAALGVSAVLRMTGESDGVDVGVAVEVDVVGNSL